MRIVARSTIMEFWEKHPDAEQALKTWYREVSGSTLSSPVELTNRIRNSRMISSDRYVFNICGNKYRLVGRVSFQRQVLYIRFIGTHAEYDKIDVKTI